MGVHPYPDAGIQLYELNAQYIVKSMQPRPSIHSYWFPTTSQHHFPIAFWKNPRHPAHRSAPLTVPTGAPHQHIKPMNALTTSPSTTSTPTRSLLVSSSTSFFARARFNSLYRHSKHNHAPLPGSRGHTHPSYPHSICSTVRLSIAHRSHRGRKAGRKSLRRCWRRYCSVS